jgi:predicted transcriptional regulator of viral defense system
MKYITDIRREFSISKKPVFESSELSSFGIGDKYKKRLLHLMLAKGEIRRITSGAYTFHKDLDVVGFAFRPFYYGLEDALSIMKISLQGTNPIVITVRNVRQGVRDFYGRNYVVKKIPEEFFFGYEIVRHGEFWIPISDLEKTIIDMVYFKEYIRDELWIEIIKIINIKKLDTYLNKYKPEFKDRVLGLVKDHKRISIVTFNQKSKNTVKN